MAREDLPYRPGVGVVLFNRDGRVFVGRRVRRAGEEVWQFPQGGIDDGESPLDAAYRELEEETGIPRLATEVLSELPGTVAYDLPDDLPNPPRWASRYRGQEQRWFAMRFIGTESEIRLDSPHPEFDAYRWVTLEDAVGLAVPFKRPVYETLARVFGDGAPRRD